MFLRYRDRCAAAGIRASIVPGILPITRFPQLLRFAERCGASVPEWLRSRFDGLDDDPDTRRMIAANVAIEQVQRLRQHGVDEFHFYTLNRAELAYAICHALGIRPRVSRSAGGLMAHDSSPRDAQAFTALLKQRVVIFDGAMGTMIQRHRCSEEQFRGERFKDWRSDLRGNNDLLSLTQPRIIADIHRAYLDAGADVISTNTFNSTSVSQADYGMQALVGELNLEAARLARQVADECGAATGVQRFVAGALGPTSRTASLSPDVNDPGFRNISFDELVAAYSEVTRALIAGGVDMILIETMFDTLNAKAALFAVRQVFDEVGERAADHRLGHDHRCLGPDVVGPDHGGVLEFHSPRQAVGGGIELRARAANS